MQKTNVAGLKIDFATKKEFLDAVLKRIQDRQKTWVTTVYSEFLFESLKNPQILNMLNQADFALPDGISVFWAKKFLSLPLTQKNYLTKILQSFWQAFYSLAGIIFLPGWIYNAGPNKEKKVVLEKIPGSDLIWDIAKLAAENHLSVYLLGGFNDTPKLAGDILISKYPDIDIAGYSSKNPQDKGIITDLKSADPDILMVAYGPIKQERWIYKNTQNISAKLIIGMGGAFDYIAGKRISPPSIVRKIGLEWLFRLVTQPYRISRIYRSTLVLILMFIRYKVFQSYPLRPNVVAVILNKENKILVCERSPKDFYIDVINTKERLKEKNYWQLPQGGINNAEDVISAAKREAKEEVGLINLDIIKTSEYQNIYFWNSALRTFWRNRNHKNLGQQQNIVYFKHNGADTDVKVDQKEFINFKWINLNNLLQTVHPDRRRLAEIITKDLKEMEENGII